MPALATQIRHAATTDHRIPRSADARRRPLPSLHPDWSPLLNFQELVAGENPKPSADDDLQRDRNLALALVMAMDRHTEVVGQSLLPRAVEMLAHAVGNDPADIPAHKRSLLRLPTAAAFRPRLLSSKAFSRKNPNASRHSSSRPPC